MKIFIIGVNGFIGSHLIEYILNNTDWKIEGVDLECRSEERRVGKECRCRMYEQRVKNTNEE